MHENYNSKAERKYFGIMKTSHGFHFLSYQLLLIEHFRFHLSYLLQQSKVRFLNLRL